MRTEQLHEEIDSIYDTSIPSWKSLICIWVTITILACFLPRNNDVTLSTNILGSAWFGTIFTFLYFISMINERMNNEEKAKKTKKYFNYKEWERKQSEIIALMMERNSILKDIELDYARTIIDFHERILKEKPQ